MYCGQCGKKVKDNMLFCPFCGTPIEIPEQDEAKLQSSREEVEVKPTIIEEITPEPIEPVQASEKEEENEFVPLDINLDVPDDVFMLKKPKRTNESTHKEANLGAGKRSAQTYIPVRDVAPSDLFMDSSDDYDTDAQNAVRSPKQLRIDKFRFEEEESSNFFKRHLRGIVGVLLLIAVVAALATWAFMPGGQRTLAKFNLAWKAEPYNTLGHKAYTEGQKLVAAKYFERAFECDSTNYEYAHNAMIAYYDANDIARSAEMLKKCIVLRPTDHEPYTELLLLYPEPSTRPKEITELIRLGYQRTGRPDLNIQ